jgi:hypothetical protein
MPVDDDSRATKARSGQPQNTSGATPLYAQLKKKVKSKMVAYAMTERLKKMPK